MKIGNIGPKGIIQYDVAGRNVDIARRMETTCPSSEVRVTKNKKKEQGFYSLSLFDYVFAFISKA